MVHIEQVKEFATGKYKYAVFSAPLLLIVIVLIYVVSQSNTGATAPNYDIVLPQRTSIDSLGGWQRVSPNGSEPVFSYNDTIESVAISVSQQPLPPSFVGNVGAEVKRLADSYSATTMVEAGGTQVYIGRSAKGPQSVIFAKNNTLVLIKSQKTITQAQWVSYINNLVDPDTEQTPTF